MSRGLRFGSWATKLKAVVLVGIVSLAAAAPAMAFAYPPQFKTSFVKTCKKNASVKKCECVVAYIEKHEPFVKYAKEIAKFEKGGPIPPVEVKAIKACGLTKP
jgi:hypothetical protein